MSRGPDSGLLMGDLVPYRSPQTQKNWTSYLGMVVFLASWAVLFAGLFFSYGVLRSTAKVWPPVGVPRLPLGMPGLNTAIIFASSVCLQLSLVAMGRARVKLGGALVLATLALGSLFLGLQVVVWQDMYAAGLKTSSGTYGSMFYALTFFHALHVVVGLVAMLVIAVKAFLGKYHAARHHGVKLWTIYWHFVGVIWGLLYLVVY